MPANRPDLDRRRKLGAAIAARRAQLGLSRAAIYHQGGPSHQAMHDLETGKRTPTAATQATLERLLGWQRGTCAALLRGEHPDIHGPAPTPTPPATPEVADLEPIYQRLAWLETRVARLEHDRQPHLEADDDPEIAAMANRIDWTTITNQPNRRNP